MRTEINAVWKDQLTYHASRAINTLLLYNILGTSYGILVGVFILSIQKVIASFLPIFDLIEWYGFIAFGILLFNIKPIVKKEYLDPDIEKRLVYIRQIIKEGNLTKAEERAIWRNAVDSIIMDYRKPTNDSDNLHNPTPE